MKIKFQPLYIFIIILILLIFSRFLSYNTFEGFIAFNKTTPPLNQVYISHYTKNNYLYKVHDSIYFDSVNGNVIELFGTQFSDFSTTKTATTTDKTTSNIDTIGSSLTDIVLMSRPLTHNAPLNITHYDKSKGELSVDDSVIGKNIISNYHYSIVPNSSNYKSYANITYNYQVLYIPVGETTILHIYDCTNTSNVNVGTYLFRKGQAPAISMYKGGLPTNLGSFVIDSHENNNKYVDEPLYDSNKSMKTYQVSCNVLFDTTNRNLILKKNNSISVYNGSTGDDGRPKLIFSNVTEKGVISNTTTSFQDKDFPVFEVLYILDTEHNSCVLYIPFPSSKKTVIAIISMDPTVLGLITVRNVVIFNPESDGGIEGDMSIHKIEPKVECSNTDTTNKLTKCEVRGDKKEVDKKVVDIDKKENDVPTLDSIISDYYSKYFNNNTPAVTVNGVKQYSNDFLLKTQVIPPICPACPGCPHTGNSSTCTNCGGNGGSGMLNSSIDTSNNNPLGDPSKIGYLTVPATIPSTTPATKPAIAAPILPPAVAPIVTPSITPILPPAVASILPQVGQKSSVIEPNTQTRNALPVQNNSYTNYGATVEKSSSDFMPVTSNFCAFGK